MAFLLGSIINENKKILQALQNVPGFGAKISSLLSNTLGLGNFLYFKNLKAFQHKKLLKIILFFGLIYGTDLRQKKFTSREVLRLIKHRKALRFFKGLPVRGQRTKTNAQTAQKKLA